MTYPIFRLGKKHLLRLAACIMIKPFDVGMIHLAEILLQVTPQRFGLAVRQIAYLSRFPLKNPQHHKQ